MAAAPTLKDVKTYLAQHEVDYADIFERSELLARYDAVKAHVTKVAEQRLRAQANRAVQRGSHELAVRFYTDALQLDGVPPELQSQLAANRSAAYLALGLASDALADGQRAVQLDENHVKAFYRRGMAELALRRWPDAVASFESALALLDAAGCAANAEESEAERKRTAAFRDALEAKLSSARAWESTSKLGACALGARAPAEPAPRPAEAAGEGEGGADPVTLLRKLDEDLLDEVFSHLRVGDVCAAAPACGAFARAAAAQPLWHARSLATFAGEAEAGAAGGARDWRVFFRERRRRVAQWADGAPLAISSLAGHQSRQPIYGVSVARDLCASSSEDGTVLLRDLGSAARGVLMTCSHGAGTLGVWLAPTGRRLASGGFDSTLKLWSLPRWDSAHDALGDGAPAPQPRVERCLLAHSAPIVSVLGFGGDVAGDVGGAQLLSTSFDGTLRHWDWERGALVATRDAHAGHASSVARDEASAMVYTGGDDGRVRAWDLRTEGPAVSATTEHAGIDGAVWAIATSPAGGGHQIAAGATGGSLCLWDSRAGFARGPLESLGAAHADAVAGLQFVDGGRCLVSSSFDSTLRLWDSPFYGPASAAALDGRECFYGPARAQPLSGTWGPPRQTIRSAQLSRCTRIAADDLRIVVGCIGMPLAIVEML